MAFFNIFKKKEKSEREKKIKEKISPKSSKHPKEEKEVKKPIEKAGLSKETQKEKEPQAGPSKVKEKKESLAWKILKSPHVTEKATDLAKGNQYIFKVWPRSNKTEIKKAIEDLYGVKVVSVKVIKVPRRRRRLGRIEGWRKGYKKAIVKLKEGQKIEVLPR
ncbi:MAG: 50S ribosomal protein L23 [Candidatus Nealsonbacteria bacterium CG_4_8_14_3_um_filter_37_23]|nr:MAG: 50S ribosomal protein L23 [Candidatus Nealsonbacteria bacterium CG_4_8_14_3_um_filter_37_23]